MISNELDLKITQLQKDISENTKEIYRLQDLTTVKIRQLRDLQAKRDDISSLRVHVLDDGIETGVRLS